MTNTESAVHIAASGLRGRALLALSIHALGRIRNGDGGAGVCFTASHPRTGRPAIPTSESATGDLLRTSSRERKTVQAEHDLDQQNASWRERATNAEALVKTLRAAIRDRDGRISDLTGQLYDPNGNHLAERNAELPNLVHSLQKFFEPTKLRITSFVDHSTGSPQPPVPMSNANTNAGHDHNGGR